MISQVEFYKDSRCFSSSADIKIVYEALSETIVHLKNQVEYGCKFMPEENPQTKKSNYKFFVNRVVLGDIRSWPSRTISKQPSSIMMY